LAFTGEPAQGAEEVAGTKRRRVMKRAANTAVIALLALVALAGASAAVPSSVTAAGLIYACVNNSSGTIHVVSETGACSNNEVRLVWANQDQVGALQQAVATLQAQIAAAGHALTSPNGQYSVGVADDGIVLEGPGVSIRLDAGDPASPTPTVTVSGTDVFVVADKTTQVMSGTDTRIRSGTTIQVEASGTVSIKGATVDIN